MRPLLLRRLLLLQQSAAAAAAAAAAPPQAQQGRRRLRQLGRRLMHTAEAEGRNHGQLLLCCLALAALGAATTTGGPAGLQQQQQPRQKNDGDDNDDDMGLLMGAEDFVAHGRRLNVRVSPWLSALPEGPERPPGSGSGQRGGGGGGAGRKRRRPVAEGGKGVGKDKEPEPRRRSSKYVIVGMGVAGATALRALLACEPDAEVTVVEAGPAPPGFDAAAAAGRPQRRRIIFGGPRVTFLWETAVAALDADGRELRLSDGSRLAFGKCLLAVGAGRPRVPARFVDPVVVDRVLPLGNGSDGGSGHGEKEDRRHGLARLVAQGRHVTIVGSNWASVELASYLSDVARRHGWTGGNGGGGSSVTLVFPESTPLAKELPRYLSGLLLRRLERRGVEVLPHTALKYIGRAMDFELRALNRLSPPSPSEEEEEEEDEEGDARFASPEQPVRVYLTSKFASLDGAALLTDRVVIGGESGGGGRRPPVRFAAGAHGLETDARSGSLVVSHELMASSAVFVAGDAAHFPSAALGQRLTVRSADHAYHSGWIAGVNMAGRGVRYEQLPLFFGCVPRLGVRAAWVGTCDGAAETHGFWWRNTPGSGAGSSGNGAGSSGSSSNGNSRLQQQQQRGGGVAADAMVVGGGRDSSGGGGGGGGLGDRVKGAFSSLFGSGGGGGGARKPGAWAADNTSSAVAAMGIGVGVGAKDSKAGRQLGLRRSTTVDRALLDMDAEALLLAAAEEEQGTGAAGDAAVAFTPVNGTGLVFFMDAAGGLRGVLAWGLVPPPPGAGKGGVDGSDDGDDDAPPPSTAAATTTTTTTRAGLTAIDPVLCGVIERARAAVAAGVRDRTIFKYDMNSRAETLAALKGLAMEVLGPAALEQLGPKQPLYTYTSAKTLSANSADEALFRLSNTSKAASEAIEEAYEAAVKGRMAPIPGTNSVPFPFNRN